MKLETLKRLISSFVKNFTRVHYHEYEIRDETGDVVGHEIITTRGGFSRTYQDKILDDQKDHDETRKLGKPQN